MIIEGSIKGSLVELRSLTDSIPLTNYVKWLNDPKVNQYLESRFSESTEESINNYICDCNNKNDSLLLGIYTNELCKHIGNIKLSNINTFHSRGYIGLLIGEKEYWGKGVATESISLITQYAIKNLNLRMVLAGFYSNNAASMRAFSNAGFHRIASIPDYWVCGDQCVEHIVMQYNGVEKT